ncbi:MAG: hypothetical protein IKD72_07955 [Clostridia bacterium]|nr:hypothetical protein [Clostridia bacterium]
MFDEKHPRRAVLRIFSVQIFAQGKEAAEENASALSRQMTRHCRKSA